MAPRVDKEYREKIHKARKDLLRLILEEKCRASDLLRLAYASQFSIANYRHDAAGITSSTDAATNAPQSADNNKLITAIEKIKADYPTITYPDLYQLAGIIAVEKLGGPIIEFVPGREDSSISPDESWLPDGKQGPSDLKEAFHRVGISDSKHIVALCGGLKLVRRADSEQSGVQGKTSKFDNSYFVELKKKEDSSPTDKALLDEPDFRDSVQRYAENNKDFFRDYEESHKKLSEFGLPLESKSDMPVAQKAVGVAQKAVGVAQKAVAQNAVGVAVGVAVAAAVVILSVFYLINRRRAKHSSQQFQ